MARYIVPLTTWANTAVEVETDETDPNKIAKLAEEQVDVGHLCHNCANDVDLGDEWTAVTLQDSTTPEVTKLD